MTYWTTNLCPNPSVEASTYGWAVTDDGVAIATSEVISQYGSQSLQVTTGGGIGGQGVIGPSGQFPDTDTTGSLTIGIWGETGTLKVSAVTNPGGTVLDTAIVVLNGAPGFQVIVMNDLAVPADDTFYVLVQTTAAQAVTFYVDGVMYEPESPAHAYCDGDQSGCYWEGTAELSASYQPYQYSFASNVGIRLGGYLNAINPGEIFSVEIDDLEFFIDPQDGASATAESPAAALTDFGLWEAGDNDPAMSYCWWNNAGIASPATGYATSYGMFVPPLDYPVSNGQYAWYRAAYGAVGFEFGSVPAGATEILTNVQAEYGRTATTTPVFPSQYQHPRQLQVIIKPNRLNYITNPAFQVNTSGWTGIYGNEDLASVSTYYPTDLATYDNVEYGAGTTSCQVVLLDEDSSGLQITIPCLIPSEIYTASFYVLVPAGTSGIYDVIGSCSGGSADLAGLVLSEYAYGGDAAENIGYGAGPYGGIAASNTPVPTDAWTRISFSFAAASDTETLLINANAVTPVTYPLYFYVAAVLVEPGDILLPYFDGNSGPDALWETNGTPGLCRSYYYEQYEYGQPIVAQALAANTPLGITFAQPLYAVVPTQ